MATPTCRFYWTLHLTALAPRCNVPPSHANRSRMGTLSLEGGLKSLLTRLETSPEQVRWQLDGADPALVRLSDNQPLALVWAGPELADLIAMHAALRHGGWLPQTFNAKAAA